MKLLAGGCSLIYGSEINDATIRFSRLTYPALIAKQFDLDYICVANPGNGNDAICRRVIEELTDDVKLVVVNWSYHDRFEFHYNDIGWQNLKFPNSAFEVKINELAKPFYSQLTELYSWYKYLQDILLLQTFLTDKNIPFIFSSADDEFFNNITIKSDELYQKLYSLIDFSKWFYWRDKFDNNIGFVKWAKTYDYPMGPAHHPLESAHQGTYELIRPIVETIL